MNVTISTSRFHDNPGKFTEEEYKLYIMSNLLVVLQELDIISIETWSSAMEVIEFTKFKFMMSRNSVFVGKI